MLRFLTLVCVAVHSTNVAEDGDYSYDYDEPDVKEIKTVAGSRLINARAADTKYFQFVGALFITSSDQIKSPTCSAALISPHFALR